ncbi:type IV secretory pathway VirB4 component [Rhizobium sp. BK077]|nr:type IV secretory pathway VirB4 component [Rhizobium sp. BK112]MBB3371775.1 type IV secretory pathway VirB4 component [Rhizobium sp. BK077]MBB4182546.1 type IV secretory pathway VirB4 component [Rhizobium sp. BK109]
MPSTATLRSRELGPETFIPYVRHVDETTIALESRALMVMVALEGISFETADVMDLNSLHRDLNTLYRNIADDHLALWSHVIRRRDNAYPDGAFANPFSQGLNARYRDRMIEEDLFRNDLYLSLVWHPGRDPAEKAAHLLSRLRKARRDRVELDEDALKHLRDKVSDVTASFSKLHGVIDCDCH